MKKSDLSKYTLMNPSQEDSEIEYMDKHGVRFVTSNDDDYPEDLRNIYASPKCLFVKGRKINTLNPRVAIVGSRRCSAYGMKVAQQLGFDLASNGYTIVSGMAKGIDQASHRGALKAGGKTIAVMGTGFDHLYPAGSKKMYNDISVNGAVITEHPSFAQALPANFPRRNRMISGLSLGVIVVEAAARSGSLITARLGLEQGKEIFAIPGRIDNRFSDGTNKLINDGAKLVTKTEDILEELESILVARNITHQNNAVHVNQNEVDNTELTFHEVAVRDLFKGNNILNYEDIVIAMNEQKNKLSEILLRMEMKKIIKSSPGKNYELAR